jgi:hypothetical protein
VQITFSTEAAAEAAVEIWERHGFTAVRSGTTILTDCPSLWAVPIIDRTLGLHQVERLDLRSPPDVPRQAPGLSLGCTVSAERTALAVERPCAA